MLGSLPKNDYFLNLCFSMLGNAILGLGIVLEIRSRCIPLSGEAFVLALSIVLRKPFSSMKIANDVRLVVLSCVLSYLALGYLFGVREGTILSALTVGLFVRFFAFLCSQFSSRK